MEGPIVLFDGVCNLCNGAVIWILKRDRKGQFRFASLQGKTGQEFLSQRGIDRTDFKTMILVEPELAYYTQSTAALKIAGKLGGVWSLFTVFIWIPSPLRDAVYNWISRNRYRWFGRKDECMLPRPEWKDRFLD